MAWMETSIPDSEAPLPIQIALYACTRREAEEGGINRRVALLNRKQDQHRRVLLLTPEAAKYADKLPGRWTPVEDPREHHWEMSYSAGVTFKELGLH